MIPWSHGLAMVKLDDWKVLAMARTFPSQVGGAGGAMFSHVVGFGRYWGCNFKFQKETYLVGGFKHLENFPFHIWDVILPIDELIFFQRGWNHQPDIETWLEGHFLLRLFSITGHSWPRGLRTVPISLTKCRIKLGFSIYVCVCAYLIIFDGRDGCWIWQKASECSIAILKYWWVFLSSFMTPKHQEYPRVNMQFDTSIIFHLQP